MLRAQGAENAEKCTNDTLGAQQCVPGECFGPWEVKIKEPGVDLCRLPRAALRISIAAVKSGGRIYVCKYMYCA